MSSQRVLLVDDDVKRSRSVSEALAEAGHEVACANSVEAGRRLFGEFHPEVVVTGLDFVDGTGEELLDELSRDSVDLVGIVHADYTELSRARRAVDAGASGYVLDPFDVNEMHLIVRHVGQQFSGESNCARELNGLYQISEAASKAIGRSELLNMTLRLVLLQTGATRGSILLKDYHETADFRRLVGWWAYFHLQLHPVVIPLDSFRG